MDNALTASVTLPEDLPPEAARRWMEEALEPCPAIAWRHLVPAPRAACRLPAAAGIRTAVSRSRGSAPALSEESRFAVDYVITPGLLESLGVPLREGRLFVDGDGADAPLVAIVNETMARRFLADPVADSVLASASGDDPQGQWRTVVGVVGDIRNDDADQPPLPYLYFPLAQQPRRTMTFTLRSASDPAGLAAALRPSSPSSIRTSRSTTFGPCAKCGRRTCEARASSFR